MGSTIKTLIFLAILVVIYFAIAGIYQNKTNISSEIANEEQNMSDSINNIGKELQNDIIQTANQIQDETQNAVSSGIKSMEQAVK